MKIPALLRMVEEAGFTVNVTESGPQLVKTRGDARITARLVEALKQNRGEVVLWLTRCVVCGKDCGNAEDRERMKDAAFCERGGAREVRTKTGNVEHEEEPRCPFKN